MEVLAMLGTTGEGAGSDDIVAGIAVAGCNLTEDDLILEEVDADAGAGVEVGEKGAASGAMLSDILADSGFTAVSTVLSIIPNPCSVNPLFIATPGSS